MTVAVDLLALIAKARESVGVAAPTGSAEIEVGGALVEVVFRAVSGSEWSDLTSTTPVRPGSRTDLNVGYNTDAIAVKYPVDAITVAGQRVDAETWAGLLEVLTAPSRASLALCLFQLNQLLPSQRIAELGKVRAGGSKKKPSSPAN